MAFPRKAERGDPCPTAKALLPYQIPIGTIPYHTVQRFVADGKSSVLTSRVLHGTHQTTPRRIWRGFFLVGVSAAGGVDAALIISYS
jgi:hypothetical protein